MKVLCYVRPWNKKQFEEILNQSNFDISVSYISDFFECDEVGFFDKLSSSKPTSSNNTIGQYKLSLDEKKDVINRCRLLRNLDERSSSELVDIAWKAIESVVLKVEPEIALGLTVDSYIMDLIRLFMDKIHKPYYGIIVSFVNGHFRVTARGEYIPLRDVTDSEVDHLIGLMTESYQKPHFVSMVNNSYDVFLRTYRNMFNNYARYCFYNVKSIFSKNKNNYHFRLNRNLPYMMYDGVPFKNKFEGYDNGRLKVYIPLQYFPEATVDYWVKNSDYIQFYIVLENLLFELSQLDVQVIIKEHPACLGLRPKGFYRKLLKFSNVSLADQRNTPVELIRNTDVTLVWTGSAGLEAAIMGKPVIHLGKPYYIPKDSSRFYYLDSIESVSNAINWIDTVDVISDSERFSIAQHLLKGVLPGEFRQPIKKNGSWSFDENESKKVGDALFNYLVKDSNEK